MAARIPQPKTATRIGFLLIASLLMSAFITVPACARPPPPEYWADYMLPHLVDINQFVRDNFIVTDEPVPEFPNLSPYYACQNLLYTKTGEHYVSEVWYFTEGNEFSTQTAHIKNYLASHGEMSNTTLDLLPELTQFSVNPGAAEYYHVDLNISVLKIPAIEYRSNVTSGYFVILSDPYFIAYYGRAGPYLPDDNSSIQKVLIMSTDPALLGYVSGGSVPPSQQNSLAILLLSPFWLTILFLIVIGILVFCYILLRRRRS